MAKYMTNPCVIFLGVWGLSISSYLAGLYYNIFPPVNYLTAIILLLNIAAFLLGYFTWSLFCLLRSEKDRKLNAPLKPLTTEKMDYLLKIIYLFGLITLAFSLYRVGQISRSYGIGFFTLLANPVLMRIKLVEFIESSLYDVNKISMLLAVTSSIFSIGFIILGIYLYRADRKIKYFYLLLYFTVLGILSFLTVSRAEAVINSLFFIFAYLFTHSVDKLRKPIAIFCNLVIPALFVIILFTGIDILLEKSKAYGHASRLTGFLFSVYWYIASPPAAFDEFLSSFDGKYFFGRSLFFPLYKWLNKLNLAELYDISFYGEKVFVPYLTNVYSYLRNIYEDFGIFGVAVVPYAVGFTSSALYKRACISLPVLNMYIILLVFIFFSFYNYMFISNQIYLQAIFGFLFFRFSLVNTRNEIDEYRKGKSG